MPLLRLLRFGELFALVVSVLLKVIKSSSAELSFCLLDFNRLTLHCVIRIFLNDSLSRLYKMGFTGKNANAIEMIKFRFRLLDHRVNV